jgi:hypothetical protein
VGLVRWMVIGRKESMAKIKSEGEMGREERDACIEMGKWE